MDVAQLLRHHHGVGIIEPHAAELDRLVDAEQAGGAELLEDLVGREDAVLLPLVDVRIDVLVDDRPQRAADLVVFLGELHQAFPILFFLLSPARGRGGERGCAHRRDPLS